MNGVCERMHQTAANVPRLRTLVHTEPPRTLNDAKSIAKSALATSSHTAQTNISAVSGYSPDALCSFHIDMLPDVSIVMDLIRLRDKHQLAVDDVL